VSADDVIATALLVCHEYAWHGLISLREGLIASGLGKSLRQSAAWWFQEITTLTQPSLSFKSLRSESRSFGHCFRGTAAEVAVTGLLLYGVRKGRDR